MFHVEADSAFKIYSATKCRVGKSLLSMHQLFAENSFAVSITDLEHCLSRAKQIGVVKLMSSGRYRWVRKICDAHIRGMFRKFLDEKKLQMMVTFTVKSGTLSKRLMTKENNTRYRKVLPVSRESKSDEAKLTEQNGGSFKKATRLIEAMEKIRGMRGDSQSSNRKEDTLRHYFTEKRVVIPTRDVGDRGRGSESSTSSNEDLLKDCWNKINSVLEAVTDEEYVNLRILRAKYNAQL